MSAFNERRLLLQSVAALPLAGLGATSPRAATTALLAEALEAVGAHPAISLDVPAIAENGALVPVTVESSLPGVRELLLLVDVNPEPLALRLDMPEGAEPFVAARIRLAASGSVIAALRTQDGTLHAVARSVQVTVGGCG